MTDWVKEVSDWFEASEIEFETCHGPDGNVQGWKVIFRPTRLQAGIVVEVRLGPHGLLVSVPVYLPLEYAAERFGTFLEMNGRGGLAQICMVASGQLAVVSHVHFQLLSPVSLGATIAAVRDTAREALACEPWKAPGSGPDEAPDLSWGPGPPKGSLPS